jgi:uncharacterized protein YbjQ (UPF0145 family)
MIGEGPPPAWTTGPPGQLDLVAAHVRAAAPGAGAFTSALSVDEFAALRSVGFEPIGQVMGSAVFRFSSRVFCGSAYSSFSVLNTIPGRWRTATARHQAVDRMRAECAHLGGQGVVGVRLTTRSFLGGTIEFSAIGTAVRLGRGSRMARPEAVAAFATDLSGQECAKLIGQGWRPAGLVMGHGAVVRHEWQGFAPGSWGEIPAATTLVHAARRDARDDLRYEAARFPGATVLASHMTLDIHEMRCRDEGRDHIAEAFVVGTAIVPFDPEPSVAPARGGAPLTIMRLEGPPGRREVAS